MSVAAKEYVGARINDQADTLAAIREQIYPLLSGSEIRFSTFRNGS